MRLKKTFSRWLRCLALAASILLVWSHALMAQSVTTEPVGFNKVTCLANSDTIVGVPLRVQGSITTKLSAFPTDNGNGTVTLTLHNNALPTYTARTRYLKFNGGAADGRWYDIISNTSSTVTIDLNGDILPAVASDNSVIIAQFWTLDSLFPPTGATTDWTEDPLKPGTYLPNGHAVVRSDNAITRKSEVLVPNYSGVGTNLSSSGIYYLLSSGWRKVGAGTVNQGGFILYPDNYIIIRHNTAARNTILRSLGEVEIGKFAIPITTRVGSKQDNFIALMRPLGVRLSALGLSSPAFLDSPNAISRTDELLVFNNEAALKNKSASAVYYKLAAGWRKVGGGSTDQGSVEIPAGAGFLIRKAATSDGATVFWLNPPSY